MKNNQGEKMKNMKMNSFYCEKAEKNFQTWPWSYFWTAIDLFLEQKTRKIAK